MEIFSADDGAQDQVDQGADGAPDGRDKGADGGGQAFGANVDLDGIIIDIGQKDDGEDKGKDDKAGGDKGKSGDEEGGDVEDPEKDSPLIKHLRSTVRGLEKKIKAIEKKSTEPEKKEEPRLSDEELQQLIQEHQDDPAVMIKIMRYIQNQGAKTAQEAHKSVQAREDLGKRADDYLTSLFPKYHTEEFAEMLENDFPADQWELKNYPHAKRVQAALALAGVFPKMVEKRAKELIAQRDGNAVKSEAKRREVVVQRGGPVKGDKGGGQVPALNDRQRSVAKELGLPEGAVKLYHGFMQKG